MNTFCDTCKEPRAPAVAEFCCMEIGIAVRSCRSCDQVADNESAHCDNCRISHVSDLITIITMDTTTTFQNRLDAEDAISVVARAYKPKVILDLHGVTDTVDPSISFGASTAIVSFVGKHSRTRYNAIDEIRERIQSGQVSFGVLVFKMKHRNMSFHDPGSKAWFCSHVPSARLFVDDTEEHVESVASLPDTIVISVLKLPDCSLEDIIRTQNRTR